MTNDNDDPAGDVRVNPGVGNGKFSADNFIFNPVLVDRRGSAETLENQVSSHKQLPEFQSSFDGMDLEVELDEVVHHVLA